MAERRMFAKTIIDSDAFLDMPLSSQALYFHLSMRADDEGFINNPKKLQRMIGASEDDLKLLVAKSFIIPFESGVVVIKHWKIHNYIQSDRFKPTVYIEEREQLKIKPNKAYTLNLSELDAGCIHDVSKMDSQIRLDKDSIDKFSLSKEYHMSVQNRTDARSGQKNEQKFDWLIEEWNSLKVFGITPITTIGARNSKRLTNVRARLNQYTQDEVMHAIDNIRKSDFLQGKHSGKPWQITFDWFVKPSNFPKVLEGNYTVSRSKSSTDLYNTFEENTYTDEQLESLISN